MFEASLGKSGLQSESLSQSHTSQCHRLRENYNNLKKFDVNLNLARSLL